MPNLEEQGEKDGGEEAGIQPAGLECSIWNDEHFRQVRRKASVPDDFVNSGWSMDDFVAGGGKGGTLMAPVGVKYIVKELSGGDHKTLLELSQSLCEHVSTGDTLLSLIFLHFTDKSSGRHFFVMENTVGGGENKALYDLKGCADDKTLVQNGRKVRAVHKRIWNLSMWCTRMAWSTERWEYYAGKKAAKKIALQVTDMQRRSLLERMKRDIDFLIVNRLMDYSLLVAVKASPSDFVGDGDGAHRFVRRSPEGEEVLTCISIIDYLQKWTMGKKIAKHVKCLECDKATVPPETYGRRFMRHFSARLVATAESTTAQATELPGVAPPAGMAQ